MAEGLGVEWLQNARDPPTFATATDQSRQWPAPALPTVGSFLLMSGIEPDYDHQRS